MTLLQRRLQASKKRLTECFLESMYVQICVPFSTMAKYYVEKYGVKYCTVANLGSFMVSKLLTCALSEITESYI